MKNTAIKSARRKEMEEPQAEIFYMVMELQRWETVTLPQVGNMPLRATSDGPQFFLPVYTNYEQAVAAANNPESIRAITKK